MKSKFFQLIGLALKAGKIVSGEEQVVMGIRQNKIRLVILAEDTAKNTMKKVTDKSASYQVPIVFIESRYQLGRAIGKEARVVVGVTDKGFADKLKEIHENE
jgi:ribosomal protein L7Ae-like RNA K-turn-binding protein